MHSGSAAQRRFEGESAIVTGAASGVGRATALRLAAEGAAVVGVDVDEKGLAATADAIATAGGRFAPLRSDVRHLEGEGGCLAAVAFARETHGPLHVLCNVAGVNRFHHFAEMDEADWDFILDVNLKGTAMMCRAALPSLLETKGRIVNVASIAAFKGQAYTAAYCASKGGVVQLTKALAQEYVDRGLNVNAVAPGGIETPMNESLAFPEDLDWELIQAFVGRRGMAAPGDIADAIAYLASRDAHRVHGAVLAVDQGVTAG